MLEENNEKNVGITPIENIDHVNPEPNEKNVGIPTIGIIGHNNTEHIILELLKEKEQTPIVCVGCCDSGDTIDILKNIHKDSEFKIEKLNIDLIKNSIPTIPYKPPITRAERRKLKRKRKK